MGYKVFSDFFQGLPHVADNNLPCQDCASARWIPEKNEYIAALSDGHGSWKYFRSDRGSRFAVETMMEKLEEFASSHAGLPEDEELDRLCSAIVDSWEEKVSNDFESDPVCDSELVRFPSEEAKNEIDRFEAYGATLQGALMTENYLLLLQIGDGRIVVLHEDGKIDQPVPWDEDCKENYTTSLCNSESRTLFRKKVIPSTSEHVAAVFLTSDGLEDIQPSLIALNAFFSSVALDYSQDPEAYDVRYLLESNNQKDDVSIAAIIDVDAVKKNEEKYRFLQMQDFTDYDKLEYYIQDKIRSKKIGIENAKRRIEELEKQAEPFENRPVKVLPEAKDLFFSIVASFHKIKAKLDDKTEVDRIEKDLEQLGAPQGRELEIQNELQEFRKRLKERTEALASLEAELDSVREKKEHQQKMFDNLGNETSSDDGEIEF